MLLERNTSDLLILVSIDMKEVQRAHLSILVIMQEGSSGAPALHADEFGYERFK